MLFPAHPLPADVPGDAIPSEEELLATEARWLVKQDPGTRLYCFPLPRAGLPGAEPRAFLKVYTYENWFLSLRARLFESRARREARVLEELARREVPALSLLASGEVDRGPWREASYLLTVFLEGSTTFEAWLFTPRPRRERRQTLDRVAEALRHAHARGFVHGTLYPRNVLLPREGPGAAPGGPRLFDAPWGRFTPGPAPESGRVADLACLFRFRHASLQRGELARFLRVYLGRAPGTGWGAEGRSLARRVLGSTAFTRSFRKKLWFWKARLFGGRGPVH